MIDCFLCRIFAWNAIDASLSITDDVGSEEKPRHLLSLGKEVAF